jgi:peptidoglycan/LPS O-acetylase OafA/YrhL
MTRRDSPNNHNARTGNFDQWRSRWLIPLLPAALGAVILVAAATTGHILTGVAWFALLSAIGALSAVAARFEAARRGHRHNEGQREVTINTRAMSIVGTALVIALTGCAVFTLARGESTSPDTTLLAVGGISYAIALLALRYEKS